MSLMKSTLASILVVLGACDRASFDRQPASTAPAPSVGSAKPFGAPSVAMLTPAAPSGTVMEEKVLPLRAKPKPTRAREIAKTVYVCPMHAEVTSDAPGLCPKCNMKLAPATQGVEIYEVAKPSAVQL
jgi:hypothetical protein